MGGTEAALLAAIAAHPAEDTPRLAFADWLEEQATDVDCGACDGVGETPQDMLAGRTPGTLGPVFVGLQPCPTCSGTGRVSDGRRERAALIRGSIAGQVYGGVWRVLRNGHRTARMVTPDGRWWEVRPGPDGHWPEDSPLRPPDGRLWADVIRAALGEPPDWWPQDATLAFARGFPAVVTLPLPALLAGDTVARLGGLVGLTEIRLTCRDVAERMRLGGSPSWFAEDDEERDAAVQRRPVRECSSNWLPLKIARHLGPPSRSEDMAAVFDPGNWRRLFWDYPTRAAALDALSVAALAYCRAP